MKIAVVRETREGETRVAMVPELVGKLTDLGYEVLVEPDAGARAEYDDELYVEAGAVGHRGPAPGGGRRDLGERPPRLPGPPAPRRRRHDLLPPGQLLPRPGHRPARPRHHRVRDGAGAAHLARAVDGRALLAGAGLRLPLRDRGRRAAAPLLPAEHDGCRHRPGRPGRRARRRRRRAPGDRDRPSGSAPSCRPTTCAPPPPRRSGRWARSRSTSSSRPSRAPVAMPAR